MGFFIGQIMMIDNLNQDKYLCYFDTPIQIISIYDHYRYDRSDHDGLSVPQRDYLINRCRDFGLKQVSGRVYTLENLDLKLVFPKQSILGASPFDSFRYEKHDEKTVFVLTPTQAACYFLTLSNKEESKKYLDILLSKQSINFKKIKDHVRTEANYKDRFEELSSEILTALEKINQSFLDKNKRHLGSMF